jgi:hypothetical protein
MFILVVDFITIFINIFLIFACCLHWPIFFIPYKLTISFDNETVNGLQRSIREKEKGRHMSHRDSPHLSKKTAICSVTAFYQPNPDGRQISVVHPIMWISDEQVHTLQLPPVVRTAIVTTCKPLTIRIAAVLPAGITVLIFRC